MDRGLWPMVTRSAIFLVRINGDYWDHVAREPEHWLVLVVVAEARTLEYAEAIVPEVQQRLRGRISEREKVTCVEYFWYRGASRSPTLGVIRSARTCSSQVRRSSVEFEYPIRNGRL